MGRGTVFEEFPPLVRGADLLCKARSFRRNHSRQQLCLDTRRLYPFEPRGCLASWLSLERSQGAAAAAVSPLCGQRRSL